MALRAIVYRVSAEFIPADEGLERLNLWWATISRTMEAWSDEKLEAQIRHFDDLADGQYPLIAIRAGDLLRMVLHWRYRPRSRTDNLSS